MILALQPPGQERVHVSGHKISKNAIQLPFFYMISEVAVCRPLWIFCLKRLMFAFQVKLGCCVIRTLDRMKLQHGLKNTSPEPESVRRKSEKSFLGVLSWKKTAFLPSSIQQTISYILCDCDCIWPTCCHSLASCLSLQFRPTYLSSCNLKNLCFL